MIADSLTIVRPDDWHLHLRDGAAMASVLPHSARQFARAIVMPNLKPPITTTQQASDYQRRIKAALPDGSMFEPLMTLYLTDTSSASEIRRARESGVVHAVKLYPAGATTNSESGVTDLRRCAPALEEMQRVGMPLLIHGEDHSTADRCIRPGASFHRRSAGSTSSRIPGSENCVRAHHNKGRGQLRSRRTREHRRDDYRAPPAV